MLVQSVSAFLFPASAANPPSPRQSPNAPPANIAETVRISQAAREALAASSSSAEQTGLAGTARFAEIAGKPPEKRTADEVDYMQKAAGLVNSFARLSPAEKALYDKAVASGDTEAAAGISQIALIRTGGHMAGGANGTTYDPLGTEITTANVGKYFSHGIVDPTGQAQSRFQALIRFLQANPAA